MIRFSLPFLVVLVVFNSSLAEYQLGEHPRIFLTPERVKELAVQAYGTGMRADDYALIKAEADLVMANGALRNFDSPWHVQTDMFCACIAYLIERELGNENAHLYAEAIKNVWGEGLNTLSNLGIGQFGNFAIAYDWIYDSFTEEERVRYGDYIGGWLYWYTTTPEIVLQNGGWYYNKTWGPAHLSTEDCRDGITPKLLVALALAEAGTVHDNNCKRFLDSWERRIPSDCIPAFDLAGGVWPESMGHGSYGPVKVIPWAFEAWRTATGLDWFTLGSPTSFLRELNLWAVHLAVPFTNRTAYIGDNTSPDLLERTCQWIAPILGARYKDSVANWVSASLDTDHWYRVPWIRFIAYDPEVPARSPSQAGWPTARLFTGAGHVYVRSRWNDPNATWAFFGAGPCYANHARDDEGHFLIAKKGWLVLRSGGAGHNDDDYYAGGSLAFNIVTVFDPEEQFRRVTPEDDVVAAGGTKNERDGGMIRHIYEDPHDEKKERGHIDAFKHGQKYTYAAADLTRAYRSTKVSEVTRQFLYLRTPREFFVIFDRVDAKNGEHPKHWFLHIPSEPLVSGIETQLTEGHVYSYSDIDYATWLSDPAGNEANMLSTGRSRAFLKTVLPAGATVTRRGGEDHEFWGHPEEPTAQYNHVGKSTGRPPIVPWRLEVAAPVGETRQYFLHVFEIGNEEDTQMSEVTPIAADTSLAGVRITPQQGEPVEVLFSRRDTLSAKIRFGDDAQFEDLPTVIDTTVSVDLRGDINGDGRLSILDVIILLLKGRYNPQDERLDFNEDGGYSVADAVALLYYLREQASWSLLAGLADRRPLDLTDDERAYLWQVLKQIGLTDRELRELKSLVGGSKPPRSLALYQNSPNPLNPSTTISYSIPQGAALETRLEIYNIRGQIVRVLVDKVQEPGVYQVFWDGTDSQGKEVPSGVYFYRLRAGVRTRARKMVVLR